jgi:rhamnose transport system ATP-binding protein
MGALLRVSGIAKSFAGVRALRGVSFDLQEGEVHALVGENGAGKSTLIKIMTGAHVPDQGTIEIGGRPVAGNNPVLSRALGVAAIYQQPALFPDLTVAENIAMGGERGGPWRRLRWGERRKRAEELLGRIGARISPDAPVSALSMPEQQLVEIARSLGAEVDHLFGVIRELRSQKVGIVYISHRLDELTAVADRVTVLRDGQTVATRRMGEIDRGELIRLMVGREISTVFPKREVPVGPVLLELQDLGCRSSGLLGITLSVRAGEILGLSGLVGAGRTELARGLFGLTPADSGRILVKGSPVSIRTPGEAIGLGIAYVPEDRRRHGVILEMPVAANATLAILHQISRRGFLDFRRERELAASYVQRLAVKTSSIDAPAGELSGGNQQKLSLARWLATKPSVLILDEPTQGIDVGAKAEIHRLMGDLAAEGLAILMISSELPEILGMSDRIAVLRRGHLAGVVDRGRATPETLLALALGHGQEAA